MVLVRRNNLMKKVPIRGKIGNGIIDTATMALIETGLPWQNILASIGASTYAGLAGLAVKKLVDKMTEKKEIPPPLLDGPIQQGTLKGDIVRTKESGITRIDPRNHEIDLSGDYVLNSQGIERRPKKGNGIRSKKNNNNIRNQKVDKLLNDKSKDILFNLKMGKGIFNI